VSPATAITRDWSKFLHHRANLRDDQQALQTQDPNQISSIPDVFDFQYTGGLRTRGYIDIADLADGARPAARFGYVRIKTFSGDSSAPCFTERMVEEFRRILTLLDEKAPDGLVIDIRSNPGGDVPAAERMLQMLTPKTIEPIRFHLANTPVVLEILRNLKISMTERLSISDNVKLADALAELQAWLDDTEQAPLPHGSRLTSGRPLTDPDSANDIGQIYQGRGVVLLVNSLTYSAADIFAAGFQDHGTGMVLGTSMVTGGGGGNVWSHQDLLNKIGPNPGIAVAKLPGDASMTLAIRRCSRVGAMDGQPVEDQGVEAEYYAADSVEDVMMGHPGILRRACESLRGAEEFRLDAGATSMLPDGGVTVEVRTTNIATLEFFLNGRPAMTIALDAVLARTYTVPPAPGVATPSVLRIEGYAPDPLQTGARQLVRARTIRLQRPVLPYDSAECMDLSGGYMPGNP
jgi:Peptidase family S41